jgi:hypothetical protein
MGRKPGDGALEGIAQLAQLEDLTISGCAAGDEAMKYLGQMMNLRRLVLEGCENVTDAGLTHFEGLRQLKELTFSGSKVTAAGVEQLKKALPDCKITF